MTGTFNESSGSSTSPYPTEFEQSTMVNGKNTLQQQRNTPRAQRFSQKLMKASKKSPLARYPLATPTTSVSLSPSLEPYRDDESLADTQSCLSSSSSSSYSFSPQRDDQELNRHLQELMLSPLRSADLTESPVAMPTTIYNQWRLHREKRPEVQQRGSDSPSLSVKPKRRKLKQQRTTAWRVGADVTLDTKKVHHQYEKPMERMESDHQSTCRRSKRIASKNEPGETIKKLKNTPVILGVSTGVKSSQVNNSDPILLYDDDDYDPLSKQNRRRRRRPKVDTVEERLDKLMGPHDPLDLSHHSVIPENHQGAPTPILIVLDDDSDDLHTNIKSEPNDNDDHLLTLSHTHLETQVINTIDEDEDMAPICLSSDITAIVSSRNSSHTTDIQCNQDNMDSPTTPTSKQTSLPEDRSTRYPLTKPLPLTSKNRPLETIDSKETGVSLETTSCSPMPLTSLVTPTQSNDTPYNDQRQDNSSAEPHTNIPKRGDTTEPPVRGIPARTDDNLSTLNDPPLLSRLFGSMNHFFVGN